MLLIFIKYFFVQLTDDEANTHKEWNQVQLDVHRTLARFPPNIDKDERDDLQVIILYLTFQLFIKLIYLDSIDSTHH